ncbi:DUF1851 domain-containing protein [Mucilaginibacter sp. HC2]|uniref:T6SS immunity protein Tdi1 domain-containing protein n=1 Tax=Mucilaginibacter inviolabilis TaxID=2714892 RepID=UPI001408A59F|nr:T6SS immunity protein Tdi1 domain-containing protein [Mucilaginibacter inviolabilis]NHA03830.1 DUF1851 domain-containing protein [Mucilaginibacter inviolabilis]
MDLNLDDLVIAPKSIDINYLDAYWKWLADDIKQILLVSKLGDVFIVRADEKVYWIATDDGSLSKVANSATEFQVLLEEPDNLDNWFLPGFLEELEVANIILEKNQVYSYKKLPVLGGEYTIDNIIPTDIKTHLQLTGAILEQIKGFPDGTHMEIRLTD